MASNLSHSTPATRAVGASGADVVERQSAEVLKVSTRSRPSAVAGAIAGVIRDSGVAEVQSIGAGATNQAIKAVAIARSYLSEEGIDIVCTPSFIDVAIDDEERTRSACWLNDDRTRKGGRAVYATTLFCFTAIVRSGAGCAPSVPAAAGWRR